MANPGERSGGAPRTVGIVGAGQLARMSCEAASALGLPTVVLAEHPDDAATSVAGSVLDGTPSSADDMEALAKASDVITFDHEQVDLAIVAGLEAAGRIVRPPRTTLEVAVDKGQMRRTFAGAGIPVPAFSVLDPNLGGPEAAREVAGFADEHDWPVVIKSTRGGYDGKGVWPVRTPDEAETVCAEAAEAGLSLLVEELVPIEAELAVVLARHPDGQTVVWPAVETAQIGGVCREILVPGRLERQVLADAEHLGRQVADVVSAVGVLAIELFSTGGRLLVNEIAARPHNSGHWTIEGAVTSQFENHVRAVLGLPLGSAAMTAPAVATVNVFGGPDGLDPLERLDRALAVPGAHVHLYGKGPRPGRKLGHVTVLGDDQVECRQRAWQAAVALGTPVPDELDLPRGAIR